MNNYILIIALLATLSCSPSKNTELTSETDNTLFYFEEETDNPYLRCEELGEIEVSSIDEMGLYEVLVSDSIAEICNTLKQNINSRVIENIPLRNKLITSIDSMETSLENSVSWSSIYHEYSVGTGSDMGRSSQEMRLCLKIRQLQFVKYVSDSYNATYLEQVDTTSEVLKDTKLFSISNYKMGVDAIFKKSA